MHGTAKKIKQRKWSEDSLLQSLRDNLQTPIRRQRARLGAHYGKPSFARAESRCTSWWLESCWPRTK